MRPLFEQSETFFGILAVYFNCKYFAIYMLWFKIFLGLNFIFFCFKLIIIYYHTQKQKKIKFKPRIILNHNIYTQGQLAGTCKFVRACLPERYRRRIEYFSLEVRLILKKSPAPDTFPPSIVRVCSKTKMELFMNIGCFSNDDGGGT